MILLDTNILVHLSATVDPQRPVALRALNAVRAMGELPFLVPQNIYEFWASATRPVTAKGLGLTPAVCESEVQKYCGVFPVMPDPPGLYDEWHRLVVAHSCLGRVSYDARLVAAMNLRGVSKILTFNTADFARYPGLTVLDPRVV